MSNEFSLPVRMLQVLMYCYIRGNFRVLVYNCIICATFAHSILPLYSICKYNAMSVRYKCQVSYGGIIGIEQILATDSEQFNAMC